MAVDRSWKNLDERISEDLKGPEETASEGGKVHEFTMTDQVKCILIFSINFKSDHC